MGTTILKQQSLLFVAHFSQYNDALAWSREQLSTCYGKIAFTSESFPFEETTYYCKTMGEKLQIQLLCFKEGISPEQLSQIKIKSNEIERICANSAQYRVPRPINIDPGYITQSKLVLASTKDASHRIYLTKGIFAETTLTYYQGHWKPFEWTYPNYRRPDYQSFLDKCRQFYLNHH